MAKTPSSDWEILPRQGLGKIRFGMSRAEVAAFDAIYGELELDLEEATTLEEFLEDLGPFADDLSEEELQGHAEDFSGPVRCAVSEFRCDNNLRLYYEHDKLVEITVLPFLEKLTCGGKRLYKLGSKELVALLMESFDEVPLCKDNDLAFAESRVYLWDFTRIQGGEYVSYLKDSKRNPLEQTISWSPEPRDEDEDFSDYIRLDPEKTW